MADLRNLETFVAAALTGSFAAAARQLGISPAMVGRRIQSLEDACGAKLIERTTRKQRLTDLGTEFLAQAARVLDDLEGLAELTRPQLAGLAGRVRVTGPTTLGIKRLSPLLAQLAAQHPALSLELDLSDRNVDLIAEGYDLAIRIGNLKPSSLVARRIGAYAFVCCASPQFVAQHGSPATPPELAAHRCVLDRKIVPRNRWPFGTQGDDLIDVEVQGNLEIDNGEALRMAVLQGAGIAYTPLELVKDDLTSGALVEVLADWRKLSLPVSAVYPSRRFVPRRVTAVIEACANELRKQ
ncbi:MAG: LysR family transcriptional regulator [Rhizobiaceae bacterium]|nr:LysR family transcriptional regulator [Rhizobiaceae bacterium]